MTEIRYVQKSDKEFWFTLDKHISEAEFENKVQNKQGYVLFSDNIPVGILRYNLFWDNTPFCNLLFIDFQFQKRGYGKTLMTLWEQEMKNMGFGTVMTSSQSDETAQHFYRKLGYRDCGGLIIRKTEPTELFFVKEI